MPLRIVVLGMMGRCPFGGQTWLYLNWLRALDSLGCEVWYVEDDVVWPYDPIQNSVTDDCSYAVQHIANCMEQIGLKDRWAFRLDNRKDSCQGLSEAGMNDLYRSCDALLNIVGATALKEHHLQAPFRVYIETDPVTAELQLANGDAYRKVVFENHHHVIATYGENYGAVDCGVPLNGLDEKYIKTRQPIDLDLWPMTYRPEASHFTTVGNYRQTGSDVEYQDQVYRWSKHHEWEKFISLPQHTTQTFQVAMMPDDPEDRERLQLNGWGLTSPLKMSLDIFGEYPEYFRQSRGEFTVAKDQNVRLRSGWFSERDVCYLATGKPVVTQETGFSNTLPVGEGLFAFHTMEDAVGAIEAINSNYETHCRAARSIAEEFFDGRKVARALLGQLGLL